MWPTASGRRRRATATVARYGDGRRDTASRARAPSRASREFDAGGTPSSSDVGIAQSLRAPRLAGPRVALVDVYKISVLRSDRRSVTERYARFGPRSGFKARFSSGPGAGTYPLARCDSTLYKVGMTRGHDPLEESWTLYCV